MSWKRKDWLTAAALAALGATGLGAAGIGPLAGMFGAAGAAGGAAGAAGGAGLLGAGSVFGPTAAQAGLLGTFAAPTVTPMITGAAGANAALGAASGAGGTLGGTAGIFGPSAQGASMLSALQASPSVEGLTLGKGLQALNRAQQFSKLAQGDEKPKPAQWQPMAPTRGNDDVMALLKRLYGG